MEAQHRDLVTAAGRPDPPRVVLVDDHDRMRWAVRQLLEATGCTVAGEAADGPAGVEAVRAARPDVLVTDLHLPGCDGLEVARRARALLPGLRVVLFTADPPAAPLPAPSGACTRRERGPGAGEGDGLDGAGHGPAACADREVHADGADLPASTSPLVDAMVGKGVMPEVLLRAVTPDRLL